MSSTIIPFFEMFANSELGCLVLFPLILPIVVFLLIAVVVDIVAITAYTFQSFLTLFFNAETPHNATTPQD